MHNGNTMPRNRYQWVVHYTDGTRLEQVEADGRKNAYEAIDRARLKAFELWDGAVRLVRLVFQPGQRLIWRRRVEMSPGGQREVCHIVGKQETREGKNIQGILALFESDGRVEVAERFDEKHPWFYPPVLSKEEYGRLT